MANGQQPKHLSIPSWIRAFGAEVIQVESDQGVRLRTDGFYKLTPVGKCAYDIADKINFPDLKEFEWHLFIYGHFDSFSVKSCEESPWEQFIYTLSTKGDVNPQPPKTWELVTIAPGYAEGSELCFYVERDNTRWMHIDKFYAAVPLCYPLTPAGFAKHRPALPISVLCTQDSFSKFTPFTRDRINRAFTG